MKRNFLAIQIELDTTYYNFFFNFLKYFIFEFVFLDQSYMLHGEWVVDRWAPGTSKPPTLGACSAVPDNVHRTFDMRGPPAIHTCSFLHRLNDVVQEDGMHA